MLIHNTHIIDPVSGVDAMGDIQIRDKEITRVALHEPGMERGQMLQALPGEQVIDATGLIAAPGLMDTHVHFRDPGQTHKEDIESGASAALKGGFTRVVCMANTLPPIDTPELLRANLEKGKKTGLDLMQASAVTKGLKGKELVDMEQMRKAGACAFTDDGIPLMDSGVLYEAMRRARALACPISLHEEDPAFVPGAGVNAGVVAKQLGYPGAMALAEEVMVARDCLLALRSGARVIIQHISCKGAVELVRLAKTKGADIHAEATPHHFTLTEEAVLSCGTNARMNPPLRTEADRQAIIEGLQDGTIDLIVTDHAPHAPEEKARPMESAPSGIIGLETSLALGIKSLVHTGKLSMMQLIRLMSTQPALVYGVEPAAIMEGQRADLVLFEENGTWTVDRFASKSSNSPFCGWKLPGRVCYTVAGGQVVYQA